MKLLLINASPKKEGSTHAALSYLARLLAERGLDARLLDTGAVRGGCLGCGGCVGKGRCVREDAVNVALSLAPAFDGYVFASPVYYGDACGNAVSFLERFFYAGKGLHAGKYGAALTVARRAGGVSACDRILRYFPFGPLTAVTGTYWTTLLAKAPDAVAEDAEGLRHLASLADAFARLQEGT